MGWAGLEPDEIVGENDFGNLIVRDTQGRYWRMCPEEIYCKIVAESRAELDALGHDQEFLRDWYMEVLVSKARDAVGPLSEGRKYHLVIPAALGGQYVVANIKTSPLVELIRFPGDIGRQIRDLPPGSKVRLKVAD